MYKSLFPRQIIKKRGKMNNIQTIKNEIQKLDVAYDFTNIELTEMANNLISFFGYIVKSLNSNINNK